MAQWGPMSIKTFVFFFFCFLDGFAMLLGRGPWVFWFLLVFPMDLLPLCVGLCLVGALQVITYITPEHMGGPYVSHTLHQNIFAMYIVYRFCLFME